VNVTPVLPVIATQTVNELNLLTVANTAAEPNFHASMTYKLASLPSGMTVSANGIITWIPSQTQSPSTNLVTTVVTATDVFDLTHPALTATNSFTVVVKEVNVAPTLPVIATQTVNELKLLTVTNTAVDSNIHASVGYTLVGAPSGISVSAAGIITWTPSQAQSPSTNIITTVAASTDLFDLVNPHLSATNSFTVVVKEVNVPPVLPLIVIQTINELQLLTVTNTAAEANIRASVGYTLLGAPTGVGINATGIITWTPSQAQSPSTNVIVTVATSTDASDLVNPHLSATNSFTVVVKEVNVMPALPVIATQTVNELNLLMVTNTAVESNSHANLVYTLVGALSGMGISGNGIITWTPAQAQSPSTNLVTTVVTATDVFDPTHPTLSATNSFTVVVKEVNVAPTLPVIATQMVNELKLLTVTNTAVDSNIHASVGYTLVGAPSGMSIGGNGIITWTPSQAQSPSTNLIVTVATSTDTFDLASPHLSATNSFTVVVKEINVAPVLPLIGVQTSTQWKLFTVTNTAAEQNIHATVSYALQKPPAGASIDAGGIFSWAPSQSLSPSTNVITTVATSTDKLDLVNPVLSATNTFIVVLNDANVAPPLPVIGLQTVNELTLLTVTNTASESLVHAKVTYALASPPAGAAISSNGIFTWTPSQTSSPSTNTRANQQKL
jgi:hypothetical protein